MEKLCTILIRFAIITILIFTAAEPSCAQKKGDFDEMLTHEGSQRAVSFLVPTSYSASKKWHVVIGFHPYQTSQTAMRQMLTGAATQLNFILACPDDQPDYNGTITTTILDYLKKNYNIDESNIVLTGYSAGGGGTFGFGLANYQLFKGLIGIATAPYNSPGTVQAALKSLPIGFVVGTDDQYFGNITSWIEQAKPYGAITKLIEKSGVGHTGQYFWGTEFTTDWVELYDFIQKTVFPPGDVALISPEDGAEEVKTPAKFNWYKASKAKNYEFQIAELDDFKKLTETKTITDSFYTVKTLKKNATFYWRVRAKNDGGNGNWSETRSIKTEQTIPLLAPMLGVPENGAENIVIPVKFEWEIVEKATKYHIQIFEKNITIAVIDEKNVPVPEGDIVEFTAENLKKGVEYTWKVCGASADGDGPWSETYSFITQPEAPTEKALLSYPADNMEKAPSAITFEWGKVAGAVSYQLQIREDGSQEPVFQFTKIPATGSLVSYEVTGLKPSTVYWWKVRGDNDAGEGPWSNEFKFTTDNFVSVSESNTKEIRININPNPATDFVYLDFNISGQKNMSIEIFGATGDCVYQSQINLLQNVTNRHVINTGLLQTGIYFIRLSSDLNVQVEKLIISR